MIIRRVLVQLCRTVLAFVILLSLLVLVPAAFGRSHVVLSASMAPALRPGDVVISRSVPGGPQVGRIVVVQAPGGLDHGRIHRVVGLSADGQVVTRGDAGLEDDGPVPVSWVQGELALRVPGAGLPTLWLHERNVGALALTASALVLITLASRSVTGERG